MTKRTVPAPDLNAIHAFTKGGNEYARNRDILDWLCDDGHRAKLFALINKHEKGRLSFPSRDSGQRDCDCEDLGAERRPPNTGHREVVLVTDRDEIQAILTDDGSKYSNRVYAELGGGSFMLALDSKAPAHTAQRDALRGCFHGNMAFIPQLAYTACQSAAVMALRAPEFDLAAFAEQAAVRFCQMLFGYSFRDYPVLEPTLRAAYKGLVYQVLGRHFATDPLAIPAARQAMGRLLARTGELIDAYHAEDEEALEDCKDPDMPAGATRVLEQLAKSQGELNAEQRAILAVGAAVGTVGNVQAAACIAVKALFCAKYKAEKDRVDDVIKSDCGGHKQTGKFDDWKKILGKLLRDNPPIPFLPRMTVDGSGKAGAELLLALGGGAQACHATDGDDPLIWGLPGLPSLEGKHWCLGQDLAWPLIVEIVRHVMCLPGLDQRLDPTDCSVIGLKKRWGFACESYPLTHQRERRVAQSSLNVAMRLKSPVKESADRVREVIRAGAPRIEQALLAARHVHFAWFELIESDTVLVLHTVYDGPFSAYLQHFALKVGSLFDALFECIENPPPMPVKKFPHEFVAHLLRYDRAPTMGYFFSAYPRLEVAAIQRIVRGRP